MAVMEAYLTLYDWVYCNTPRLRWQEGKSEKPEKFSEILLRNFNQIAAGCVIILAFHFYAGTADTYEVSR